MIYITGDTHGEHERFTAKDSPFKDLKKGDYLIVCGDFGYIYFNNDEEKAFLDYLESLPFTICFCDGNHENFPAIYSYPSFKWNGGYVHQIRKNIFHLMRGQVFEIEGKKIFTMGGAYSIDRYMRKKGYSFWEEEIPKSEEYGEAIKNLKAHNSTVDIVITHTAPGEIIKKMGYYPDAHDGELTGFLEWIMYDVKFKNWFYGHWHIDETYYEKFTAVYFELHAVN